MGGLLNKTLAFLATLAYGAAAATGVHSGTRPLGFAFNGVSNRIVTPNGDHLNDNIAFRFDNPRDAAGSVKIYDVRGHLVATLSINPGDIQEVWNATSGGALVPTGIYIFVITIDGTNVSGAVAVIR